MAAAELLGKCAFLAHLFLNLLNVIEVVSEGGVDFGESDRGDVRNDLVWRHPLVLMPGHDVEHADAVTGDTGLAAANTRRFRYPLPGGSGHDSSIDRASRQRGGDRVPLLSLAGKRYD